MVSVRNRDSTKLMIAKKDNCVCKALGCILFKKMTVVCKTKCLFKNIKEDNKRQIQEAAEFLQVENLVLIYNNFKR